jgi:pimeloyl-ACP methyl ester carboxylesterase
VLIEDGIDAFECELLLPAKPVGVLLFQAGEARGDERFCEGLVDLALGAKLAVLILPFPVEGGDEEPADARVLQRLLGAAWLWLCGEDWSAELPKACFGAGAMAAPMLRRASSPDPQFRALVVYEGLADMGEADLEEVEVPTLFVADAEDPVDAGLHQRAADVTHGEHKVLLVDRNLPPPRAVMEWISSRLRGS